MCDLILATYTQTLAEMEEGPTTKGLLDSGLLYKFLLHNVLTKVVFFRCTKLCHYVDNNGKDFQVCGLPSPSTCGNSYPPSSKTPLLQSLNNIPEGTLLVTLVISHHLPTFPTKKALKVA